MHYSIQNFLQKACIMLQNLCIMLKIIPNKLFYAKDRIECFYSIQVNVLLEYLDPVTVLLDYIDRYS